MNMLYVDIFHFQSFFHESIKASVLYKQYWAIFFGSTAKDKIIFGAHCFSYARLQSMKSQTAYLVLANNHTLQSEDNALLKH